MKKLLVWLFQDFLYKLYDMAENKFTLSLGGFDATKSFSPSTIPLGSTSLMTIIIQSINTLAVTFTDIFPSGMQVASTPSLVNPFGVALVSGGNPGDTTIQVVGGAITLNGTATLSVNVTVPIGNPLGNYSNTILGTLNPTIPAILTVTAAPKKKKNAFRAPLCFDASTFPNAVCPETFLYKPNSFYRGLQLYRIGNTCCYTSTPTKK